MFSRKTKPVESDLSGAQSTQSAPREVTDRLAGLLPGEDLERALEGLEPDQITGPGGLLSQLAGRVIETALGAELTEHLGYPPGQAPPLHFHATDLDDPVAIVYRHTGRFSIQYDSTHLSCS